MAETPLRCVLDVKEGLMEANRNWEVVWSIDCPLGVIVLAVMTDVPFLLNKQS